MARYAPRAFGGPVFLSNMVTPRKRYVPRVFGGPILLSGIVPLPDTNITVYSRSGDNAVQTRSGDTALYER